MSVKVAIFLTLVFSVFSIETKTQGVMGTHFLQAIKYDPDVEIAKFVNGQESFNGVNSRFYYWKNTGSISAEEYDQAIAKIDAAYIEKYGQAPPTDLPETYVNQKATSTAFLQNLGDDIIDEMYTDVQNGEATLAQAEAQLPFLRDKGYISREQYDQAIIDFKNLGDELAKDATLFLESKELTPSDNFQGMEMIEMSD
ncbi:unnamed protein product [Blepharisma stoltei]|uniref:Uncharacterized protein n=1 Tax=Blepharisma stoltei TaxID=1481888 RepID=A0AAU9KEF1_9CILI|nr:unnamed protein product [Blepharisma stoltei]